MSLWGSASPLWGSPGVVRSGKRIGKMVIGFFASIVGWKLNPVVGAVYGPEFYAGKGWKGGGRRGWAWLGIGPSLIWKARQVGGVAGGVVRQEGGMVGAWPGRGVVGQVGMILPGVARCGCYSPAILPALTLSRPWLSQCLLSRYLSCSDRVPVPHHGHSRCLQGRSPTGQGPGRV